MVYRPAAFFFRLAACCTIAVALLTAHVAQAQPIDSFSDHLLSRMAFPTPAAYHARSQQLVIGTVDGDVRKIGKSENGSRRDLGRLLHSVDNSILRVRIDAARDRLWILDIGNVHVFDLAKNRLVRSIALPNWYYAGHGTNCLPDLQLDRQGAAVVSNTLQPKLWRIDAGNFSVRERAVTLDADRNVDAGFSAIAFGEGGAMFAAIAASGSLWRIDTKSYRAEKIAVTAPLTGACAIETLGPARPRDFTLLVLAAGSTSFEIKRVEMSAGLTKAYVHTVHEH